MSASKDAFKSKKAQRLACGMCGMPRPGKKETGICDPCFDYHIAIQAYNVRCAQAAWHYPIETVKPERV